MCAPGSHAGSGSLPSTRARPQGEDALRLEGHLGDQELALLNHRRSLPRCLRRSRCRSRCRSRAKPQQRAGPGEARVRVGRVEPDRRDAQRLGPTDVGHLVVEEDHVGERDVEPLGQELVQPGSRFQVPLHRPVDHGVDVAHDLDAVDPLLAVERPEVVGQDPDPHAGLAGVAHQPPGAVADQRGPRRLVEMADHRADVGPVAPRAVPLLRACLPVRALGDPAGLELLPDGVRVLGGGQRTALVQQRVGGGAGLVGHQLEGRHQHRSTEVEHQRGCAHVSAPVPR